MSKERFLATSWERFRRMVIPPQARPVQVAEMRKAFYAGTAILWEGLLVRLSASDAITPSVARTITS